MNISIKDVREEDWRTMKSEAAKENLKIGEFLNKVLTEYRKAEMDSGNWNKILKGEKYLNDKDAEIIKKSAREFRKGFDFR